MEISKEEFENLKAYISNLLCIADNCDPANYLEPEDIEEMHEQYAQYKELLERFKREYKD